MAMQNQVTTIDAPDQVQPEIIATGHSSRTELSYGAAVGIALLITAIAIFVVGVILNILFTYHLV